MQKGKEKTSAKKKKRRFSKALHRPSEAGGGTLASKREANREKGGHVISLTKKKDLRGALRVPSQEG